MSIPDNVLGQYLLLLSDKTSAEINSIKLAIENSELNPRDVKVDLGQIFSKVIFLYSQASHTAYEHFKTVFN